MPGFSQAQSERVDDGLCWTSQSSLNGLWSARYLPPPAGMIENESRPDAAQESSKDSLTLSGSRVGIVTFPDGTYCQFGAWYPSPSALGFYR